MPFLTPQVSHWLVLAVLSQPALALVNQQASQTLTAPTAAAEKPPQEPLTLTVAIERALRQHPDLQASQLNLDAAEAGVNQAGRRPNPTLAIESEDVGRTTQTYAASWIQPIELGNKRGNRIRVAERERDAAKLLQAQKRNEVVARARGAFIKALLAYQQLRNQEENARLMQEWADSIRKRVEAGKSSPLEAERAHLAALSAVDASQRSKRDWSVAMNQLALHIGQDVPPSISALGVPNSRLPDWGTLQAQLSTTAPAQLIEADIQRAEAEAALQRSVGTPDVQISAGVKNYRETSDNGVMLGVSVPLPFANRNQGGIRQAHLRLQQARVEQVAKRRDLETRVGSLWEQMRGLQKTILLYDNELMPGAEKAFAKAREGYQLGKFAFIDVLDAQRSLIAVRTERYDTLKRYAELESELESIIGPLPPAEDPSRPGAEQ